MGENKIESTKIIPFSLDAAILLSVGTGVAYSLTFYYEKTSCEALGIPASLISVDFSLLAPFWTSIMLTILSVGIMISALYFMMRDSKNRIRYFYITLYSIILYLLCMHFGDLQFTTSASIAFFIIIFIVNFIGERFMRKINDQPQHRQSIDVNSLSEQEFNKLTKKVVNNLRIILTVAFVVVVIISYGTVREQAKLDAEKQRDYYFLDNMSNKIVLKIYGDLVICGDFNPKINVLTGNITVIKINDGSPITLSKKIIKPLVKSPFPPLYIFDWQITQ